MNTHSQSVDNDLVNLGLIAIAFTGLLAAILRLAGTLAAWVTGADQPIRGWSSGLRVLADPRSPGVALGTSELSAWAYWGVMALLTAALELLQSA